MQDFPTLLKNQRKKQGMTQQQLAEACGLQSLQIKRYEGGKSIPMLDALHGLCVGLSCSADLLVFGNQQRGPEGQALRDLLAKVEKLPPEAQVNIQQTLEVMLVGYSKRRPKK